MPTGASRRWVGRRKASSTAITSDLDTSSIAAIAPRQVGGRFWHQGATRRPPNWFADPPHGDGRYHRRGGRPAWYASTQEQAAWAELFRHLLEPGVSPFEVIRRVGVVAVADLAVLDLCDPAVRTQLGVTEEDLTGDDYDECQRIADVASQHFDGILAPSAALPGRQTLVVFAQGMSRVAIVSSRVRRPPPRLADLIADIRLHRDVPAAVRGYLRSVGAAGADAVRRRRRQ